MSSDGQQSQKRPSVEGSSDASTAVSEVVSSKRFLKAILKSELLDEPTLRRTLATVKVKNGGEIPEDTVQLAQLLVATGLITEWQATHLVIGRSKGFFLGKYKLIRHLGTGGMATVYLAEHRVMNKRHAIKVLPKERLEKPGSLNRFRAEARTAAMLDHPNIVRTLDIDEVGGRHFIVMEYIDGTDLEHATRKQGRLPIGRAIDYLRQATVGLQHAHERGVLHRDVKPLNMLITRDGVLKVSDLGLARLRHEFDLVEAEEKAASVVGTADYMAPEQARNSNTIDGRADLYALGCTLYFMMTGSPPYTGGSLAERLAQQQMDPTPDLLAARPDTPPDLVAIYERLMEKQPADRFQTASDLLVAIDRFLAENESFAASPPGVGRSSGSSVSLGGSGSHSGQQRVITEASLFDSASSYGSSGGSDWGDLADDLGQTSAASQSGAGLDLDDFGDLEQGEPAALGPLAVPSRQKQGSDSDQNKLLRIAGIGALAVAAGIVCVLAFNSATQHRPKLDTNKFIKNSEGGASGQTIVIRPPSS